MQVSIPEAGYYWRRFIRNGPLIGCHIWYGPPHDPLTGELLDRSHRWQATTNGIESDPLDTWISCASHPITEAEYRYLIGLSKWAKDHAPDAPEAKPREKIDLNKMEPLF